MASIATGEAGGSVLDYMLKAGIPITRENYAQVSVAQRQQPLAPSQPPLSTPPSSVVPLASGWVDFEGTEVARNSIARDGPLLRYLYRQYGSVIKAAVHCGEKLRSDIGADGVIELKSVFPGTRQNTVLEYVCDVGRTG
jgi:hypothetical protein